MEYTHRIVDILPGDVRYVYRKDFIGRLCRPTNRFFFDCGRVGAGYLEIEGLSVLVQFFSVQIEKLLVPVEKG